MTVQFRQNWTQGKGRGCPFPALVRALMLGTIAGLGQCPDLMAQVSEPEYDPDVIVVMKDQAFHVEKGDGAGAGADSQPPRFSLVPGEKIVLLLRNEDRIAHEFVSALFEHVDLQFTGRASLVYTYTATGLRLGPGETVVLRFEIPTDPAYDLFHFWCNLHGKLYGDSMRGEVFILEPKKAASQ